MRGTAQLHFEKMSKALVLLGDLMDDIADDYENWGEDCTCAYIEDQLEEAYNRLDKARRLLKEA